MLRSKSMLGFVNEEMDSIRDTELDWHVSVRVMCLGRNSGS